MIHSLPLNAASLALPALPVMAQAGAETAETLDFSALLAGLTTGSDGPVESAPATAAALILPLPGMALPLAAKAGGKILPDGLPTARDGDGEATDAEAPAAGPEVVPEGIALPILPLPTPDRMPDRTLAQEPAPGTSAGAPPQPQPRQQAAPASGTATAQPAVAISMAPAAAPDHAAPSAEAPFDMAIAAAPVAPSSAPAMTMPVNDPAQNAAQDVARIVEQLASARAAAAPAHAALSIDHAEFGEISLRFDQRADGALAVQVSAANGEAHRAIGAALAAQGGQLSSHDGRGTGSHSGQHPAPRQDQPSRNPQPRDALHSGPHSAPQSGAPHHNGVFA